MPCPPATGLYYASLRKDPLVEAPSDLLLVLRVMGLLSGIGKQLESEVDPLEALMPHIGGRRPQA